MWFFIACCCLGLIVSLFVVVVQFPMRWIGCCFGSCVVAFAFGCFLDFVRLVYESLVALLLWVLLDCGLLCMVVGRVYLWLVVLRLTCLRLDL